MKMVRWRIFGLAAFAVAFVAFFLLKPRGLHLSTVNVEPAGKKEAQQFRERTVTPKSSVEAKAPPAPLKDSRRWVAGSAPIQLWSAPGETTGEKLDPKSTAYGEALRTGVKLAGRSAQFDSAVVTTLANLKCGDNVVLHLLGGDQVTGRIRWKSTRLNSSH